MREMSSVESTTLKRKKSRRRESMWGRKALMDEDEKQRRVKEDVVESTERSTRLSPVGKVQFQRLDAATTTAPWEAMVTLHSAGDNKRLYFLISREKEREEERSGMFLSAGKEGERWGRRPRYQRGERVWEAATNLLFCFWGFSFL